MGLAQTVMCGVLLYHYKSLKDAYVSYMSIFYLNVSQYLPRQVLWTQICKHGGVFLHLEAVK